MPNTNFALGDANYTNDLNPLGPRYQNHHFTAWSSGQNLTSGTPGTTELVLPPIAAEAWELLNILLRYPAASGAVTTQFRGSIHKYVVGSATPVPIHAYPGAGIWVSSEANIPVRTVRRFSMGADNSANPALGVGKIIFPQMTAGEQVRILWEVWGVGGTQSAVEFSVEWRERPVMPVGPTMATAGSDLTFGS